MIEYLFEKGYWRTKDNKVLEVSKMKTRHLQNVFKKLKREIEDLSSATFPDYDQEILQLEEKANEIRDELLMRIK
jgi:D-hexose-6-phosphate mutarotase